MYAPPEHRCEDCYVEDQVKYDRLNQKAVTISHLSVQQQEAGERRLAEIKQVFASARYVQPLQAVAPQ